MAFATRKAVLSLLFIFNLCFYQGVRAEEEVLFSTSPSSAFGAVSLQDSLSDGESQEEAFEALPVVDKWVELVQSKNKDWRAIRDYVEVNGNVDKPLFNGITMLYVGIAQNNQKLIDLALSMGAKADTITSSGDTPLLVAAKMGNLDAILRMSPVNQKVVNIKNKNGMTALHYAATSGNPLIVRFLMSKGANVRAVDNMGNSPIQYAAAASNWDSVATMLGGGASLFATNDIPGYSVEQRIIDSPETDKTKILYQFLSTSGKNEYRIKHKELFNKK